MELNELKEKHKKKIKRFKGFVKINPNNLDKEITETPSNLFSVGLKMGEAEFIRDKSLAIYEQTLSRVKLKWAKKKIDGKKLTILEQTARAEIDEGVIEAKEAYLDAKYVFNICKSAATSMKEKGQQLTNTANNRRAELNSNIRVKKKF